MLAVIILLGGCEKESPQKRRARRRTAQKATSLHRAAEEACDDQAGKAQEEAAGVARAALPGTAPEPDTDLGVLARDNTAFAVDLYLQLCQTEANLCVCPYSLSTALAMTLAGAREETAEQMATALHFTLGQEDLHPAFAELAHELRRAQGESHVTLKMANSLWPQEGHPFLPEYVSLIEQHYGASIAAVDYETVSAREHARQQINNWVEHRTVDKIKDLIGPSHLTGLTRLVLCNAIYFKGRWENEFDPEDSDDGLFYLSAKRRVQTTTMRQVEYLRYAEVDSLQILELPYRGSDLSMLVLLPRKIEGLREIETRLTAERLRAWKGALAKK